MFKIGFQIGLKPDDVLDMNYDSFQACLQGYQERMYDQQCISLMQAYYTGYYTRAKKPKSISSLIQKLDFERLKSSKTKGTAEEVDVEGFLERERRFKERLEKQGGEYLGR